jgi:hypothetical protein
MALIWSPWVEHDQALRLGTGLQRVWQVAAAGGLYVGAGRPKLEPAACAPVGAGAQERPDGGPALPRGGHCVAPVCVGGRSLTRAEWARYVPSGLAYQRVCP